MGKEEEGGEGKSPCHTMFLWCLAGVLAALPPTIKACKSAWLRLEPGCAASSNPNTAPKPPQLLHPAGSGWSCWKGTDWKGTCGVDQNIFNKTFFLNQITFFFLLKEQIVFWEISCFQGVTHM